LSPDKTDIAFDAVKTGSVRPFLESVCAGQWGRTAIFASRIVIRVPFHLILYAEQTSNRSYTIWSLENGVFSLKMKDIPNSFISVLTRTVDQSLDRLPPYPFLFRIQTIEQLQQYWRTGRISASEYLLRLNAFKSRTFLDPENYPIFPDNRAASEYFVGHDSISLRESLELSPSIVVQWVNERFGYDHPILHRVRFLHVANLDCHQVCQQLSIHVTGGNTLFFEPESITFMQGRGKEVSPQENVAILYKPERLSITIQNYKTLQLLVRSTDPTLAFARNLAIGETGLFFVIDFTIGLSIAYKIEYQSKMVTNFTEISVFPSDGIPKSVVSDRDLVAATFSGNCLMIWNLFGMTIHRKIELDSKIFSIAFDPAFSCLLVATDRRGIYMTVNGDVLCEVPLNGIEIVVSVFLRLPLSETRRAAICGSSTGEIWLVSPRFDLKLLEVKQLESPHRAEIKEFVIHQSMRLFVSIDVTGLVYSWTAIGLTGEVMNISAVSCCPNCGNKAVKSCVNCSRSFCSQCMDELTHGCLCLLCNAVNSYV
jgi:hypothetical protein